MSHFKQHVVGEAASTVTYVSDNIWESLNSLNKVVKQNGIFSNIFSNTNVLTRPKFTIMPFREMGYDDTVSRRLCALAGNSSANVFTHWRRKYQAFVHTNHFNYSIESTTSSTCWLLSWHPYIFNVLDPNNYYRKLLERFLGCLERMSKHVNRCSGELINAVVPTKIKRANQWLLFDFG